MIDKKHKLFGQLFLQSFFGYFTTSILSIGLSLLIVKLFGTAAFGEFSYVTAIIMVVATMSRLGMDNSLVYFIVSKGDHYNSFAFTLLFFISLLAAFILYISTNNHLLELSLPLIFILAAQELFFGITKAYKKIKFFYMLKIICNLGFQLILVYLFFSYGETSTKNLLFIFYSGNVIFLTILFVKYKKYLSKIFYDINFIKFSIPMMFISFIGVLMNRIDIIMIGNYLPKTEVAIYQVLSQISTSVSIVMGIFNVVFAAKVTELYKNNEIEDLKRLYIISTRLLFFFAIFIFFILLSYKEYILGYFGSEFISADETLIIRSLGQLSTVAVGSVGFMLTMIGKVNFQLFRIIIAATLNVLLNFFLIQSHGILGAAMATSISLLISSIIGYVLVYQEFKTKVFIIF